MSLDFPLPLSKYISLVCGTSARLWRGTDITSFGITLQCGLATQTNNLLWFQENNVGLDSGYMSYLVFIKKKIFLWSSVGQAGIDGYVLTNTKWHWGTSLSFSQKIISICFFFVIVGSLVVQIRADDHIKGVLGELKMVTRNLKHVQLSSLVVFWGEYYNGVFFHSSYFLNICRKD